MPRVHQFLGDLFYRGETPTNLEAMPYSSLKYWAAWHQVLSDEENRVADEIRNNKNA